MCHVDGRSRAGVYNTGLFPDYRRSTPMKERRGILEKFAIVARDPLSRRMLSY